MKKNLCSLVFAIALFTNLNAQVIEGTSNASGGGASGDLMFGAKAGFGISTLLDPDFVGISPKPSFYVGGVAEIPAFFEGFYIQPEMVLQLQGSGIGSSRNLNLAYLHFPIMAKYHITEKIAVEFGPQVGFLLADNLDENLSPNTINLGLNLGGGYRLNENFYFNLRLSPGFTSVIDNTSTKNFVFQVGANYFF